MQRLVRIIAWGYITICLATLAATAVIGPLGYAPFALRLGPAATPIQLTIWYGTEKEAWLTEAATRFAATNPTVNGRPIEVRLVGAGSREIALRTAQQQWGNDPPPVVVSPASSMWTEVLKDEWTKRGNAGPIIAGGADAPRPLVLTPLVFVVWEERARALWSHGNADFWAEIHGLLSNPQGWKGHVGPEAPADLQARVETWGFAKYGQTSPRTSNSGTQALILMAYGYHSRTSNLSVNDVRDPGFRQWFVDIMRSVPAFDDSTGTLMTNIVRFGPSRYDLAAVYENLAIEQIEAAQNRWNGVLQVVYPPATLLSDHPYVVLEAPWTTADQRAAAARFRTFLLSRPVQELALQYGFRPADPAVAITPADPNNPFTKYQRNGVQTNIPQQAQVPSSDVLNALLDLWEREINR
jgi:hypothetical protein